GAGDRGLDRVRDADASLVGLARRDALAAGLGDGAGLLVTGVTVAGVLAVAVAASAQGGLDRVLVPELAVHALSAWEAGKPLGGAGKSTVTNLLLRFLDPEAGRVTLGGRDLRELRLADVRRAIAGRDRTRTCSRRASATTSASPDRTRGRARSSWRSGRPSCG